MKRILLLILTLCFCANAATYYVDPVDGNDAWDGLSGYYVSGTNGPRKTMQPFWKTTYVQGPVDIVLGDTIKLLPGDHSGWRVRGFEFTGDRDDYGFVEDSPADTNWITIEPNSAGDVVTILPDNSEVTNGTVYIGAGSDVSLDSAYLWFKNIKFQGVVRVQGTTKVVFESCEVVGHADWTWENIDPDIDGGISCSNVGSIYIEDCNIHHFGSKNYNGVGIGGTDYVSLLNTKIHHWVRTDGFRIGSNTNHVRLHDSQIYYCANGDGAGHADWLQTYGTNIRNLDLRRNIMYTSGNFGLFLGNSGTDPTDVHDINVVNNLLYDSYTSDLGISAIGNLDIINNTVNVIEIDETCTNVRCINNIAFGSLFVDDVDLDSSVAECLAVLTENYNNIAPSSGWSGNNYRFAGDDANSIVGLSTATLFTDYASNDFTLRYDATAVDAGTTGTGVPTIDLLEDSRDGSPDMGAYEYDSNSAPTAPSSLGITVQSSSQLDLDWTDNASEETGFKIERADDDGGSPDTWAQIDTVTRNIVVYEDTGLDAATKYHYRIRAYNLTDNSAYSNIVTDTTSAAPADPPVVSGVRDSLATLYLGDYQEDDTIYVVWDATVIEGTLAIYKDDSVSGVSGESGEVDVNGITDVRGFAGLSGINSTKIDSSALAFYEAGKDYYLVIEDANYSGDLINLTIASFSIENRATSTLAQADIETAIQNQLSDLISQVADLYGLIWTGGSGDIAEIKETIEEGRSAPRIQ